jgi:hypothetical protein
MQNNPPLVQPQPIPFQPPPNIAHPKQIQSHPFTPAISIGNYDNLIRKWKAESPYQRANCYKNGMPNERIDDDKWILTTFIGNKKCSACNNKFSPSRNKPCSKCSMCSKCHSLDNNPLDQMILTLASYKTAFDKIKLQRDKDLESYNMEIKRVHNQYLTTQRWREGRIEQLQQQISQLEKIKKIQTITQQFKTTETDDETKACKICMINESNCLIVPCCHKVACTDCIERLPVKKCPVCRTLFNQVLPIYQT